MTSPPDRLDMLRCADQDREVVAQLLNNAYTDGRLTFDEHSERVSRAYDAKTFGDLKTLTGDLVPQPRTSLPGAPAGIPGPQPVYGATPARRAYGAVVGTEFTGGSALLSTFRPGRITAVAESVTLNAWLGEIRLDLAGATFASPDVVVQVGGAMCEVKIRIPEGVTVDTSGLSTVLGEVKVIGARPAHGGVRLWLKGTILMGEVTLIGPDAPRNRFGRFKP